MVMMRHVRLRAGKQASDVEGVRVRSPRYVAPAQAPQARLAGLKRGRPAPTPARLWHTQAMYKVDTICARWVRTNRERVGGWP